MELINTCFETTNEVRTLALYSHLLPTITILILGGFVYYFSRNKVHATLFLGFVALLAVWLIGDLITWHSNNYFLVAAAWAPLDLINILFYLMFLTFFVVFVFNYKQTPVWLLAIVVTTALPGLILTVTGQSVFEFDEPNCEMTGNPFIANYKFLVEWIVILSVLLIGVYKLTFQTTNMGRALKLLLLTSASVIFLSIFSSAEFISTQTNVYEITLYSLFALPIFILILTYFILDTDLFKTDAGNLVLAKVLFAIFITISVFNILLSDDTLELGIKLVSTVVTAGFGLLLLQSVRRETTQKVEIEKLMTGLARANRRLQATDKQKSEFISIASHQLRSPLTAIRGYASMLLEGSFGTFPVKAQQPLEIMAESARMMAMSIEDYLSVSRIESGNMKFDFTDFSLLRQTEQVVDSLRQQATKQGLLLIFKHDVIGSDMIHADQGKVQQILHNLINNALKYTPKGSISVFVHSNPKQDRLYVEVTDTGIGMSEETQRELFQKFSRAKQASAINVHGTGLGLYVAKSMAMKMKGDVYAYSDGEGKGSTFVLELPII